jgi:hypothetical protein
MASQAAERAITCCSDKVLRSGTESSTAFEASPELGQIAVYHPSTRRPQQTNRAVAASPREPSLIDE